MYSRIDFGNSIVTFPSATRMFALNIRDLKAPVFWFFLCAILQYDYIRDFLSVKTYGQVFSNQPGRYTCPRLHCNFWDQQTAYLCAYNIEPVNLLLSYRELHW